MSATEILLKGPVKEEILKKDFMIKRSMKRSKTVRVDNYKSRWFLLCPNTLYYCEGNLESGPGRVKGCIALCSVVAVEQTEPEYIGGRLSVFQIVYRPIVDDEDDVATLYVKASHDLQRDSWVADLRAACFQTGSCSPIEKFHPAAYHGGMYLCCDNIDRRAVGCQATSWLQFEQRTSTVSEPTSPAVSERNSCNSERNSNYSDEVALSTTMNISLPTKRSPVPQPPSPEVLVPAFNNLSVLFPIRDVRNCPLPKLPGEDTLPTPPDTNGSPPVPLPRAAMSMNSDSRFQRNNSQENCSGRRFSEENFIGQESVDDKLSLSSSKGRRPVPKPRRSVKICVALYNFKAQEAGDLSLCRGEEYEILDEDDKHWWRAKSLTDGKIGLIPSNFLAPVKTNEKEDLLVKYNWYLGDIERKKAEELLLTENREGAFIIRTSTKQQQQHEQQKHSLKQKDHSYTLSLFTRTYIGGRMEDNVRHYRIHRNAEDHYYITETYTFRTIPDLVAYHKKNTCGLLTKLVSAPTVALRNSDDIYYTVVPPPYARPMHR